MLLASSFLAWVDVTSRLAVGVIVFTDVEPSAFHTEDVMPLIFCGPVD